MRPVFLIQIGILIVFLLLSRPVQAGESLIPIPSNGMLQFREADGKLPVTGLLDPEKDFKNGTAWIRLNGRPTLIHSSGLILGSFDERWTFYEGVAVIRQGRKWGYLNEEGKVLVRPQFSRADHFSEGMGRINLGGGCDGNGCVGGRWGFVAKSGEVAIRPQFDLARNFSEGLAAVNLGGKCDAQGLCDRPSWGFIDRSGRMAIPPQYEMVGRFREGLAPAGVKGKWGVVNNKGKWVVPPQFDGANEFSGGVAFVSIACRLSPCVEGKWGLIDRNGKMRVPPQFDEVYPFSDGLAPVKANGKWGFIQPSGQVAVPPQFDGFRPFERGLAKVNLGGRCAFALDCVGPTWGMIDPAGRWIVPPEFERIAFFTEELLIVGKDKKWGLIDKSGRVVQPPLFQNAEETDFLGPQSEKFINGARRVLREGRWGAIAQDGRFLIEPKFDELDDFQQEFARAGIQKKYGLIDKTGRTVIPIVYEEFTVNYPRKAAIAMAARKAALFDLAGHEIIPPGRYDRMEFAGEWVRIFQNDRWGLSDFAGRIITQPEYQNVLDKLYFNAGLGKIQKGNKVGLINEKGKIVLPPTFDRADAFKEGFVLLQLNFKMGLADAAGKVVLEPQFRTIMPIGNGLARFAGQDGKYGLLDLRGRILIPARFSRIEDFKNGFARVCTGSCERNTGAFWGIINRNGEVLIEPRYESLEVIGEDLLRAVPNRLMNNRPVLLNTRGQVVTEASVDQFHLLDSDGASPTPGVPLRDPLLQVQIGGKWGLLDLAGRTRIAPRFDWMTPFRDGAALAMLNGKSVQVDLSGRLLASFDQYEEYDHERELAKIQVNGKWGILHWPNHYLVPPQFDSIGLFSQSGVARVSVKPACKQGRRCGGLKWGFLRTDGITVPPRFDWVGDLRGSLLKVNEGGSCADDGCEGGRWGFVDLNGRLVIPPQFDRIDLLTPDLYRIEKGGRYGVVTLSGKIVAETKFDRVAPSRAAPVKVLSAGKWGLLDLSGVYFLPPRYDWIEDFSEIGFARTHAGGHCTPAGKCEGGKWGFIRLLGPTIVEPRFDEMALSPAGTAIRVSLGERWGLLDTMGGTLIAPQFESMGPFEKGIAVVGAHGRYGLIDEKGKKVAEPRFDRIEPFQGEWAKVSIAGKWGFIDRSGKEVLPPEYDAIGEERAGLIAVRAGKRCAGGACLEGKWGVIDRTGKFVVPARYDALNFLNDELIRTEQEGKWGLLHKSGNLIYRNKFNFLGDLSDGMIRVGWNGKWGYLNGNGIFQIEAKFDEAEDFSGGAARVRIGPDWGVIDPGGNFRKELTKTMSDSR